MRRAGKNKLSSAERRLFLLLGVPGLGLSVCLTVLSTYLPVLASRFTSSRTVLGVLVGGEGFVGLLVPLWVGAWSDRVKNPMGRRLPFLLVTAPAAALALSLIPFAGSILLMALAVLFFYLAYFTYYVPYRALYADLVSRDATARAQGIQGVFIEVGMGCALVGGGLLLEVWRPLPYLVAAALLLAGTAVLARGLLRRKAERGAPAEIRARSAPGEVWALVRDHRGIRNFAVANALLALAFGGLKTFVVLWLTVGLGKTMTFTSAVMAVVAAGTVIGAVAAGKLADDHGVARVMVIALSVFSVGVLLPVFSSSTLVLGAAVPLIAFCGGGAAVLPYALLLHLMPPRSHGAGAALNDVSGGIGTLLGPAITGAAIDLLHPLFPSTQGYAAIWLVISVSTILCIAALRGARPDAGGASRAGGALGGHVRCGPNEIEEKKTNPFLKFLGYFWGPIPWMLEAAVVTRSSHASRPSAGPTPGARSRRASASGSTSPGAGARWPRACTRARIRAPASRWRLGLSAGARSGRVVASPAMRFRSCGTDEQQPSRSNEARMSDDRGIESCSGELAISNSGLVSLRLTLEPWAEEAIVEPGGTVVISFSGSAGGRMEVDVKQDAIVLYGWEGSVLSVSP